MRFRRFTLLPLLLAISCHRAPASTDHSSPTTEAQLTEAFSPETEILRTDQAMIVILQELAKGDESLGPNEQRTAIILRLGALKGMIDFLSASQSEGDLRRILQIARLHAEHLHKSLHYDSDDTPPDEGQRRHKFD